MGMNGRKCKVPRRIQIQVIFSLVFGAFLPLCFLTFYHDRSSIIYESGILFHMQSYESSSVTHSPRQVLSSTPQHQGAGSVRAGPKFPNRFQDMEEAQRNRIGKQLQQRQNVAGDSRYLSDQQNERVWLPFGFVMKEFAQRVLSRHIAQSNVVILSDDFNMSEVVLHDDHRVGVNFLQQAQKENHTTHVIQIFGGETTSPQSLDQWWNARSPASRPNWILLSIFDLHSGNEDEAFSSSAAASTFLRNGPTMTYIVLGVTSIFEGEGASSADPCNATYRGKETVRTLMKHNYKVQLLSASDFWYAKNPLSARGTVFRPNDIIDERNLDDFFRWGAAAASFSKALVEDHPQRNQQTRSPFFKAYLFATQGLDLAIPSQREHVAGRFVNKPMMSARDLDQERRAMIKQLPFKTCDAEHSRAKIVFRTDTFANNSEPSSNPLALVMVFCDEQDVTDEIIARSAAVTTWMNTNDTSTAEACCIKLSCDEFAEIKLKNVTKVGGTGVEAPWVTGMFPQQVACVTRIVPPQRRSSPILNANEQKPNVVVVMIDPLSRPQFDFMLPRTSGFLEKHGFTRFSQYTTVGNNSGPNQAALYAGKPLENRDGIAPSAKREDRNGSYSWLWDELRDDGYSSFKAEDGCIANSNMIQRLQPNTTHGRALHELFCFHFSRPNCVGGKLASEYLMSHAKQFIDAYSSQTSEGPWAALLSLIDSHEDSMSLAGIIDEPIEAFLKWLSRPALLDNTLVLLVSDHGLHYGPFFQSHAGEKERSEPVLYIRLPRDLQNDQYETNLRVNRDKWVTPFDVHETIAQALGMKRSTDAIGVSLLGTLPPSRLSCHELGVIPERHCQLVDPPSTTMARSPHAREAPFPPSVSSFYADIPRDHRLKQETCTPVSSSEAIFKNATCKCATNRRDWFECEKHPWADSINASNPDEYYALVDCQKDNAQSVAIDTRVVRQENRVSRLKHTRREINANYTPPNVLIIEIDSVSIPYADRHFSKTREVLRRHRVGSDSSTRSCFQEHCGVNFSAFSAVGPNSIANQVAALSGCVAAPFHQSCFQGEPKIGDICEDDKLLESGMRLLHRGPGMHTIFCPSLASEPYLYDVARSEGYFTFFGEEFCTTGSPWVAQDNVFPLRSDILLHSVFCRLASRRNMMSTEKKRVPEDQLYKVNLDASGTTCLGGMRQGIEKYTLGLEQIRQVWGKYHDVPKFAYLSAMAAHTYVEDWSKFAITAEAYDEHLSTFLETFLRQGQDAGNTVVVVRSDHGFQGGNTMTIDYSTQIEHRRPWTEILLPKRFAAEKLQENRDKVVTSYDFYRSLRNIMSGSPSSYGLDWTYNIFEEVVPSERPCQEARIPQDFCFNHDQPSPTFGTCNTFEENQSVFCRDPTVTKSSGLYTCGLPRTREAVDALRAYRKTIKRWVEIDVVLDDHASTDPRSGGVFLYPRQCFVLLYILRLLIPSIWRTDDQSKGRQIRVCETGFGGGHSAALFQSSFFEDNDAVEVITFDKFNRRYQLPAFSALTGFSKVRRVVGDTCKTVPTFFENITERPCDLVHGSSFCRNDMMDLVRHLRPGGIVTATAMTNLNEDSVYFGKNAQWRRLRDDGCIENIRCWKEDATNLTSSFVFAQEGTAMAHEFCVAVSTGNCYSRQNHNADRIAAKINFDDICHSHSREVPK